MSGWGRKGEKKKKEGGRKKGKKGRKKKRNCRIRLCEFILVRIYTIQYN